MKAAEKESLRQQMLLRALLGDARPGVVAGWLRDGPRFERGLAAYRANAGAVAERALAAAFPTVQQLLGEESFAALSRAFWHRHPPLAGDMGLWGGDLQAFIGDAESLAAEPYLSDVARLEWAVHCAERAADATPVTGLQHLADADPAALRITLAPGTTVLVSAYPIAAIWAAHGSDSPQRFEAVKAAFAAGVGECVRVARRGFKAQVDVIPAAEVMFTQALLECRSLSTALALAGDDFQLESWLIAALREQRLAAVWPITHEVLP